MISNENACTKYMYLSLFRPQILTKYQIKSYTQTIKVWNKNYKQNPIWQTTLTHN